MPLRGEVVKALRFLKQNPRVPEKGIRYIGQKLQEAEEEPGETQAYLRSAYQYLRRNTNNPQILRNIRRLSSSIGKRG